MWIANFFVSVAKPPSPPPLLHSPKLFHFKLKCNFFNFYSMKQNKKQKNWNKCVQVKQNILNVEMKCEQFWNKMSFQVDILFWKYSFQANHFWRLFYLHFFPSQKYWPNLWIILELWKICFFEKFLLAEKYVTNSSANIANDLQSQILGCSAALAFCSLQHRRLTPAYWEPLV